MPEPSVARNHSPTVLRRRSSTRREQTFPAFQQLDQTGTRNHRITDLSSSPTEENANVNCPPHGPTWHRETGKPVKVYP